MRGLYRLVGSAALMAFLGASTFPALAQTDGSSAALREDYVRSPLPPGFQVVYSELEGPVFADAQGRTLYIWPVTQLRNGNAGEQKGKPTCDDTHYKVTSGLMSPYPPGLVLPEVETRPTCAELWPPVLALADSKPVGKWTIVERKDGTKQWAYDGQALYTSSLDRQPGDVLGGSRVKRGGEPGALRIPVGPEPNVPPQFTVTQIRTGRLLTTADERSVYVWDKDGPAKSNCDAACSREWAPILAPALASEKSEWSKEWSVFERAPGVKQWAYRSRPLYTRLKDRQFPSLAGGDEPGWHNVYTQRAPAPPEGFTVQDTPAGSVLADARGRTIYIYFCNDDGIDQQACDHPSAPQAYRFAICGRGDPARCLKRFPYVLAENGARSDNRTWSVMHIDPATGRKADANQPEALRVWAYRDRPVYLCFRDQQPGDAKCNHFGEHGTRNGFKAFWLRYAFNRR